MSDRGTLRIQQISAHPGPIAGEGTQRQDKVCKLIDTTTCIGCKACEVACVEWNDMPFQTTYFDNTYQTMPDTDWNYWNLIKFNEDQHEDGSFAWLMRKHQCMHCDDPGCLRACPADGAIVQYSNGIVDFQQENCIGCQFCVSGCPFNIPKFNPNTKKVYKCTLCSDRVGAGLEPACIKSCPTGCLHFGTKDDMKFLAEKRATQLRDVSGIQGRRACTIPTPSAAPASSTSCTTSPSRRSTERCPRIRAFRLPSRFGRECFKPHRPVCRHAGICWRGHALHFRRAAATRSRTPPVKGIDPPPASTQERRTRWRPPADTILTSPQCHRPFGQDSGLRRRIDASSGVHPFSALDVRHLLLPRAAVGLRNLPALDLPLLHAAVWRRSHDPVSASLVRLGLRILLRPSGA